MKDEDDIRWRMYAEHCSHARHHETLRATTSNILLAISAGIIAVVTRGDRPFLIEYWPLTALLVCIGIFGALFSAKYHERFCMHTERARQYRDALEASLPATDLRRLKKTADRVTKAKFPRMFDLRLHKFWVCLHLAIAAMGVIMTILLLVYGRTPEPSKDKEIRPQQAPNIKMQRASTGMLDEHMAFLPAADLGR